MMHISSSPHSNDVSVEEQYPQQAFAAKQSCCFVASCHESSTKEATISTFLKREQWGAQEAAIALVACHHEKCSLCRIPLPKGNSSSSSQPAYVDWLYLDDDLRITRGSKGSMFIHTKS